MLRLLDRLARPFLHALDPEDAHAIAIRALQCTPLPSAIPDDEMLATSAFGLTFTNPIGVAAGLDKNAIVPDALLRLGFGFVEVGTVTPRPQGGNPRPRLFRLDADEAIINRLGFNSEGHEAVAARLAARRRRSGVIGVNIGANKDATDRMADYVAGIAAFAGVASYFTINVSSPNTPGLRDLQQRSVLDELLARVIAARDAAAEESGRKPILLKIAPDLALGDLDDIVDVGRGRQVDGLIVSNTTVTRSSTLRDSARTAENGGLSGRPLFALSTRMLAEAFVRVEGAYPLIGVGGIDSGAAAFAKLEAGASLLQLYSALVFHGVGLVQTIKSDLASSLRQSKCERLADIVGRDAARFVKEPWPG